MAQTTVAQATESSTNYYSQVLPPTKIIKPTIAARYKTLHEALYCCQNHIHLKLPNSNCHGT